MAKDQGVKSPTSRTPKRPVAATAKPPVALTPAQASAAKSRAAAASAPKTRTSPAQFLREVRAEGRKVTWTSWKETWITSVMVFIMVAITAAFFALLDGGLNVFIQQILKLAA